MISVLVADDHPVVRDGLCTMLELEADIKVVGRAADGVVSWMIEHHPLVGRADDVQAALDQVAEALGGVDVAVANAGIDVEGTVASTSVQDWERIVATNLSGVFYTAKYAVEHMLRRGAGVIIIIGGLTFFPAVSLGPIVEQFSHGKFF